MFVYTVYPIPRRPRKKATRQVEPVSRVKPVSRVEYNSDLIPPQQILSTHYLTDDQYQTPGKAVKENRTKNHQKQPDWKHPISEYIPGTLPILLEWRYPKAIVSPDYIQKYHNRLHAARLKHNHVYRERNR